MIYESAIKENLQDVYNVVQHTIRTIYPKYYPAEVVDFFCEHHSEGAILKDIENGYVRIPLFNSVKIGMLDKRVKSDIIKMK